MIIDGMAFKDYFRNRTCIFFRPLILIGKFLFRKLFFISNHSKDSDSVKSQVQPNELPVFAEWVVHVLNENMKGVNLEMALVNAERDLNRTSSFTVINLQHLNHIKHAAII